MVKIRNAGKCRSSFIHNTRQKEPKDSSNLTQSKGWALTGMLTGSPVCEFWRFTSGLFRRNTSDPLVSDAVSIVA